MPKVPHRRRLLPNIDRNLAKVNPALASVLTDLVNGRRRWPLFLFGPCGVGKTCAALALCDVIETAAYWSVDDFSSFVMRESAADVEAEYQRLAEKHLLVLDEVGCRERVGDLQYSVVKKLADVREQQAFRVAVYVSNISPERVAELYDDRIYSRLCCGTVFELTGDDRREAL